MKWGHYIKRTAVRRVVWIVVGLLVYSGLSIFGVAHAQSCPPPLEGQTVVFPDMETAYAACSANSLISIAGHTSSPDVYEVSCAKHPSANSFVATLTHAYNAQTNCSNPGNRQPHKDHTRVGWQYTQGCPAGTEWNDDLNQCLGACQGLSPRQGNFNTSLEPIQPAYCVAGCGYEASNPLCTSVTDGPNPGYWCNVMYNPTGQECTGTDDIPTDPNAPQECPVGQVQLANGDCAPQGSCPVGQAEINGECHPIGRCPTGFVKSPDGSCAPEPCPSGQARGQDGTCKADDNNDGVPDEDEAGTGDGQNTDGMQFSGGDSCAVPPTCSGDAIMCGQARIQWRIDCNTRRQRHVQGGDHCDVFSMPVCIGEDCDPVEHKQMVLAWKSACALESLVNQNGEGDGDGPPGDFGGIEDRLDNISSFLTGDGHCMASEEGCSDGPEIPWDDTEPTMESWSSGLPSSGTCPAPVVTTVAIFGQSVPIEFSYQPICDFAAYMRWVLIAAATIMGSFIVAGIRLVA